MLLKQPTTDRTCVQYFHRFRTYSTTLTWDNTPACVQISPSAAEPGILAAGKNVVGTQTALSFVGGMDGDFGARIEAACTSGQSSFYESGVNGDTNLAVLSTLMTNCRRVDSVSTSEVFTIANYDEPLMLMGMGLGLSEEEQPGGAFYEHLWKGFFGVLQQRLGVEIDEVRHAHEVVFADHSFDVINYTIKEGTVTGVHHILSGWSGGRERITFHGYYWVGEYPTVWPSCPGPGGYRVNIKGSPDVTGEYYFTEDGLDETEAILIATAMRPVNAIPAVCEAKPGVTTFWDLPTSTPKLS